MKYKIDATVRLNIEAIIEGQMRLARGLQRNESSCCIHELEQLAQAAQDEKGVGDGKV